MSEIVERRKIVEADGREFTLLGARCISCNRTCGKGGEADFSKWTAEIGRLDVEIYNGGWRGMGDNDTVVTTFCWYGEKGRTSSFKDTLRSDLKQPDGWTPRVCLNNEEHSVRDAEGKVVLSDGLVTP